MHYHRYLADTSASLHGDALSRIGLAETLSKEANKLAAASFSPYFLSSVSSLGTTSGTLPADAGNAILELTASLSTLTAERRAEATRENDLIYNSVPTAPSTLPPVEKLVVATPIPIQEVYGAPDVQKVIGPDLFGRLVPLSVHKSASIYSEEKAKLIRGEAEKCEVADESLSAALSSLGLPGALQKWKDATQGHGDTGDQNNSEMFPQEVYEWVEELEDSGGIEGVERARSQLITLRTAVGEALDSIGRDLESESRECEAMRVCTPFTIMRSIAPSSKLTQLPTKLHRSNTNIYGHKTPRLHSRVRFEQILKVIWKLIMRPLLLIINLHPYGNQLFQKRALSFLERRIWNVSSSSKNGLARVKGAVRVSQICWI